VSEISENRYGWQGFFGVLATATAASPIATSALAVCSIAACWMMPVAVIDVWLRYSVPLLNRTELARKVPLDLVDHY
jgi:hypothetical protein